MPPEHASLAPHERRTPWAAITRFNLFPAEYLHDSWREQLTARLGSIEPALSSQPFWIRELSTTLLRERQLHDQFDFDFLERSKRLALLDAPTLHRLCLVLAGLLVRQHLRLLVSRDDASLIQRSLGQDIHKLVLEWRGPMPVPAAPALWPADWRSRLGHSDAWARRGVAIIYSALPPQTLALHGRLRFKFPIGWPEECFSIGSALNHRESNANVVVTALSMIAPECSWLFDENVPITEVAA
ncbi:SctK family type III secretion system sorting platform protein [Steroidobacter sp. S1-65]|uniref:SctK family type III secretion system sorting platform protein n=1 Tax=Steroidobacter gossypii TaxID=2805490 RepID=A0ABS1X102_9GAMM|nr:SctK family type III secretion system sorting platform protein [Steroidobacter gossypii]MBM0106888.1 SctK family type III secretion system sorting platform protein [Steroidobacter gossypii]